MQSHPVKRVVSGALAASAVIAAVTFTQTPATASPTPALQQPQSSSEALEKYRELASKAEKLNEEYLKAQEDLKAKEAELKKVSGTLKQAKKAQQRAMADVERFRVDVDRFAGASFTAGSQLNKMSALLTGSSAQDFLDRSSALDVLATDKNEALQRLQGAVDKATAAEQQASEARRKAQQAKDAAAKLAADIEARKERLDEQVDDLAEQAGLLSDSDVAAQQDTGVDIGPVQAPGPAAQAAVDAALSVRGSPYVWGATGPDSFDCSGLTQWAYAQAGISIPRTSSSQSTYGTPVSRSQLQPGDLVFYYSPVSHVGIYLGDGMMVHAPTSGDVVKVSPLQDEYSGARRVA
ncbi:cell wall-associated hydrolase, invasion-associated protein [Saccharomonospora marina XMU15]|uniref:Cell wall-associated hydrolase, invasion-associated protein n=1 Tax=Saccharomonospora marina XMU15 TaxID=882083 RepID=H5X1G6_9PSEU|nr:C40 family peptidase [Saccharomonospora marina]EHR49757.1 cell wall-associated hydrolase, invasion-associated protein [Saccharomonospora marina XMU15]